MSKAVAQKSEKQSALLPPRGEGLVYDVIGDIHGHADELRELLGRLGYEERNGAFSAPSRKAIFVGDFVDRGPKIRETLEIVRSMVSRDAAQAVMGNHEFNALCYHTADGNGSYLRPHTPKNTNQHAETLEQLAQAYPEEWEDHMKWFKGLPTFLELGGLRVVHAAWSDDAIRVVRGRTFHDPEFLEAAATQGTPDFAAVEALLKGPEIRLPEGVLVTDKGGNKRSDIRVAWWNPSNRKKAARYSDVSVPGADEIPSSRLPDSIVAGLPQYPGKEPPVIFGHYWLPGDALRPLSRNAACIDFSVARPGGFLTAYSWRGEKRLQPDRFTLVPRKEK